MVDGKALQVTLQELVGNAVKHGGASSVIVRTTLGDDVADLCVEVVNDGVAIHEADAERIFEPFWQHGEIATRSKSGLGLGLSLARQLAERAGGSLTLTHSAPATFRLQLPATAGSVAVLTARRSVDLAQAQALKAINDVRELKATLDQERSLYSAAELRQVTPASRQCAHDQAGGRRSVEACAAASAST